MNTFQHFLRYSRYRVNWNVYLCICRFSFHYIIRHFLLLSLSIVYDYETPKSMKKKSTKVTFSFTKQTHIDYGMCDYVYLWISQVYHLYYGSHWYHQLSHFKGIIPLVIYYDIYIILFRNIIIVLRILSVRNSDQILLLDLIVWEASPKVEI